jgi:hypothetical protein
VGARRLTLVVRENDFIMFKFQDRKCPLILTLILVFSASSLLASNYSTPENTLDTYISALRAGNQPAVAQCFYPVANDFYLPNPLDITSYSVTKKIVYGKKEVDRWNRIGIKPPTQIGDVELQVNEILHGKNEMFSYVMRKISGEWKIISHSAWRSPD